MSNPDAAWEEALREQGAGTHEPTTGAAPAAAEGASDWAAALAEQTSAERPQLPQPGQVFQQLAEVPRGTPAVAMDMERIKNIPVQLTAELGRTRITLRNLLQLSQGSVVELDGLAGQPLDVQINGYLVAQGEVVVVNDKYGIRLTDIIAPSDRIQKLSRS